MAQTTVADLKPGDVVSYNEMCLVTGASLQRGMNFRLPSGKTVILMSRRPGAPYEDQVSEDGHTLTYEGHDCSKNVHEYPKQVDQPERNPGGSLTQNGLFVEAVRRFTEHTALQSRSSSSKRFVMEYGFITEFSILLAIPLIAHPGAMYSSSS